MLTKTIPCQDCAAEKLKLEQLGFRYLGCEPIANREGFCTLSFADPAIADNAVEAGASVNPMLMGLAAEAVVRDAAAAETVPTELTTTQRATAKAIVNLFETGQVLGRYDQVTLLAGDSGHLTFGRSQTTLGSGNLGKLIAMYCANPGARFGPRLQRYVPQLLARDLNLDHDLKLHNLLRASADDPVMRGTQDAFFDQVYWTPASIAAQQLGFRTPLGYTVVYDSYVHGSWKTIRNRTTAQVGTPQSSGETAWVSAYVRLRRQWLGSHPKPILRATVYRMDALRRLIDQGYWSLNLPLVVRGKEISEQSLAGSPPGSYAGPLPASRSLSLQVPLARGLDVRLVQLALSDRDYDILADGIFGQTTFGQIKRWQSAQGETANGILDPAAITRLLA